MALLRLIISNASEAETRLDHITGVMVSQWIGVDMKQLEVVQYAAMMVAPRERPCTP
jgi:hypothetical protein